jgi:hypothetical protein
VPLPHYPRNGTHSRSCFLLLFFVTLVVDIVGTVAYAAVAFVLVVVVVAHARSCYRYRFTVIGPCDAAVVGVVASAVVVTVCVCLSLAAVERQEKKEGAHLHPCPTNPRMAGVVAECISLRDAGRHRT